MENTDIFMNENYISEKKNIELISNRNIKNGIIEDEYISDSPNLCPLFKSNYFEKSCNIKKEDSITKLSKIKNGSSFQMQKNFFETENKIKLEKSKDCGKIKFFQNENFIHQIYYPLKTKNSYELISQQKVNNFISDNKVSCKLIANKIIINNSNNQNEKSKKELNLKEDTRLNENEIFTPVNLKISNYNINSNIDKGYFTNLVEKSFGSENKIFSNYFNLNDNITNKINKKDKISDESQRLYLDKFNKKYSCFDIENRKLLILNKKNESLITKNENNFKSNSAKNNFFYNNIFLNCNSNITKFEIDLKKDKEQKLDLKNLKIENKQIPKTESIQYKCLFNENVIKENKSNLNNNYSNSYVKYNINHENILNKENNAKEIIKLNNFNKIKYTRNDEFNSNKITKNKNYIKEDRSLYNFNSIIDSKINKKKSIKKDIFNPLKSFTKSKKTKEKIKKIFEDFKISESTFSSKLIRHKKIIKIKTNIIKMDLKSLVRKNPKNENLDFFKNLKKSIKEEFLRKKRNMNQLDNKIKSNIFKVKKNYLKDLKTNTFDDNKNNIKISNVKIFKLEENFEENLSIKEFFIDLQEYEFSFCNENQRNKICVELISKLSEKELNSIITLQSNEKDIHIVQEKSEKEIFSKNILKESHNNVFTVTSENATKFNSQNQFIEENNKKINFKEFHNYLSNDDNHTVFNKLEEESKIIKYNNYSSPKIIKKRMNPYEPNLKGMIKNQKYLFESLEGFFSRDIKNDLSSSLKLNKFFNSINQFHENIFLTEEKNSAFNKIKYFSKKNFISNSNEFKKENLNIFDIYSSDYKKDLINKILSSDKILSSLDKKDFDNKCLNLSSENCNVEDILNITNIKECLRNSNQCESLNNKELNKLTFWELIKNVFCFSNFEKEKNYLKDKFNSDRYLTKNGIKFLEKLFIDKIDFSYFIGK